MKIMAVSTTGFSIGAPTHASLSRVVFTTGRRHISYKTARTLEILAHAIEYLTNDYFYQESGDSPVDDARLKAVQLLMTLNREVYLACPRVPTLRERWHSFLHPQLD